MTSTISSSPKSSSPNFSSAVTQKTGHQTKKASDEPKKPQDTTSQNRSKNPNSNTSLEQVQAPKFPERPKDVYSIVRRHKNFVNNPPSNSCTILCL